MPQNILSIDYVIDEPVDESLEYQSAVRLRNYFLTHKPENIHPYYSYEDFIDHYSDRFDIVKSASDFYACEFGMIFESHGAPVMSVSGKNYKRATQELSKRFYILENKTAHLDRTLEEAVKNLRTDGMFARIMSKINVFSDRDNMLEKSRKPDNFSEEKSETDVIEFYIFGYK